jgi:hypothetical protein
LKIKGGSFISGIRNLLLNLTIALFSIFSFLQQRLGAGSDKTLAGLVDVI